MGAPLKRRRKRKQVDKFRVLQGFRKQKPTPNPRR